MLALISLHHYSRFSISTGNFGGGGSYTLTGELELKEVTAVFSLISDHINYITIVDENGNTQVIETTDGHPFWVVTDDPDLERAAQGMIDENGVILHHNNIAPTENGFWVEAKDLREGDVFLGANGELSTVVAIERVEFPDGIAVYNLTVDGNHNYFVIAACDEYGQTSILVHNAGYDTDNPNDPMVQIRQILENTNFAAALRDIAALLDTRGLLDNIEIDFSPDADGLFNKWFGGRIANAVDDFLQPGAKKTFDLNPDAGGSSTSLKSLTLFDRTFRVAVVDISVKAGILYNSDKLRNPHQAIAGGNVQIGAQTNLGPLPVTGGVEFQQLLNGQRILKAALGVVVAEF
jgi:hypothetical protein